MPIPIEDAGRDPELWLPGKFGVCMICGEPTEWAYLSFGFMHPACHDGNDSLDSPGEAW